jgi:hypothetical protein
MLVLMNFFRRNLPANNAAKQATGSRISHGSL